MKFAFLVFKNIRRNLVLSSLTPHKTGPNVSNAVRKAYIVQFAPNGALAWRDGAEPQAQDVADRQFAVLVKGRPIATAASDAAVP